ncbi:MAG: L-threonylcarbamoyladenylate synthase, partial [Candidatus Azotimanducaceae bacterium]
MNNQRWRYRLIAKKLRQGAVIAYPTEGVWGLGCVPENQEAVARLLKFKSRPWQKGLILAAANIDQILPY